MALCIHTFASGRFPRIPYQIICYLEAILPQMELYNTLKCAMYYFYYFEMNNLKKGGVICNFSKFLWIFLSFPHA